MPALDPADSALAPDGDGEGPAAGRRHAILDGVTAEPLTPHVSYEVRDRVAHLRLTRPEVRNALSPELATGIELAVTRIQGDPAIRAVVLAGEGPWFCAGGDLRAFASQGIDPRLATSVHDGLVGLSRLPAPVIAAIAGGAIGYGLGLACACDIRIAEAEARFAVGFTGIGLSPDSTTSYFLPRLIGLSRARALALTNQTVTGTEAAAMGLVWRTTGAGQVLDAATELAATVATLPSGAMARSKMLLEASLGNSLEQQVRLEIENIAASSQTSDFREGVTAFVERRQPHFSDLRDQ